MTDWNRKPPKGWDPTHPEGCWMDDLKTAKVAKYGMQDEVTEFAKVLVQAGHGGASLEVQRVAMESLLNRMVHKPKKGSIEAIVADVNARLKGKMT